MNQTEVNNLFTFSPAPGTAYTGSWVSGKIFTVFIDTAAGTAPAFTTANVRPAGTTVIRNAKQPTLTASLTPQVLSGHWGSDTVLWVNDAKLIVDGNEILRPSIQGEGWNAGAVSSRSFTGDGYLETIAEATGKKRMIGFSEVDIGQHFSDLNYAFYMDNNGQLAAYELGVQKGLLGTYKAGDALRLNRSGTDMIYSINGLVRRTTTVDPTQSLQVDTSLYSRNAVIDNTVLVLPSGGARSTSSEAIRDAVTIHLDSVGT